MSPGRDKDADVEDGHGGTEQDGGWYTRGRGTGMYTPPCVHEGAGGGRCIARGAQLSAS